MLLQASAQGQPLLLQARATGDHQAVRHRCLLQRLQQPAPEGQLQAMLAGCAVALPGQHGLVTPRPPKAAAGDALQQRRVGLQPQPARGRALEPQAHHRFSPRLGSRQTVAWPHSNQSLKALHLLLQGKRAVRAPLTLISRTLLIKPGAPPAAHPAAQQAIGEHDLGQDPGGWLRVNCFDHSTAKG